MDVQLILVPYDSGHRDVRMGHGPEYFAARGVAENLRVGERKIALERIEAQCPFLTEISTSFELHRLLAQRVQAAQEHQVLPLILAGNCNSALGTLAGIEGYPVGVIWFDAHGDFNTPETTTGGFLDGMAAATATGRCWTTLIQSIPGFTAIPDERVLMVGVRQLDEREQVLLEQSQITLLKGEQIQEMRLHKVHKDLEQALTVLNSRVQQVYLHIDLDVLDTKVGRANSYAVPGGLTVEEMEQAITMIVQRFKIAAIAFTAYDPSCDPEENILRAGLRLMEHVVQEVEKTRLYDLKSA